MKLISTIILTLFLTTLSVSQNKSINESKFISIGGIEQWITIKGNDISKPVILFIHGGPGSTMSQYENTIYGEWEENFVLVNWDQRGAGRTYGRNKPENITENYWIENPLTVEQMAEDGIELTKYITNFLEKKKVILVGTSWGSILGAKMALINPELFHAYIGHAQFVNFSDNISYSYQKVYEMAKNRDDNVSIEKLIALGEPPYSNAKSYGELLRIVKQYERENSNPAPNFWWKIDKEYDNEKDSKDRYDGDDYSFINFVGHEKLGIRSMVADIDFEQNGLEFKIPIYMVQGEQDILTSAAINRPYFEKIKAPSKGYFLLPDAAHGHNQSVVDKQFEVLNRLKIND